MMVRESRGQRLGGLHIDQPVKIMRREPEREGLEGHAAAQVNVPACAVLLMRDGLK
jgi:hypothetical protein